MLVCIYDDRADALDAVKIAVLSVLTHEPDLAVSVGLATASVETEAWFRSRGVALTVGQDFGARGWDVKPGLLLSRLSEGAGEVLWWDSDVVASGPFRHLFDAEPAGVLVATEDTYWGQEQGGDQRTVAWGLTPGRRLSATVNTGLLRVSTAHHALLEAWQDSLRDPRYAAAQRVDMLDRPLHLLGDQEVLTALLGSTRFADVPVHLLRRGVDVAQCFGPAGYRVTERVHGLRTGAGLPPLVHATNPKPWRVLSESRPGMLRSRSLGQARAAYESLHAELSPYTVVARQYGSQLSGADWLWVRSPAGRVLSRLPGPPAIVPELPVAAFDAAVRMLRRRLRIGRFELADTAAPTGIPSP